MSNAKHSIHQDLPKEIAFPWAVPINYKDIERGGWFIAALVSLIASLAVAQFVTAKLFEHFSWNNRHEQSAAMLILFASAIPITALTFFLRKVFTARERLIRGQDFVLGSDELQFSRYLPDQTIRDWIKWPAFLTSKPGVKLTHEGLVICIPYELLKQVTLCDRTIDGPNGFQTITVYHFELEDGGFNIIQAILLADPRRILGGLVNRGVAVKITSKQFKTEAPIEG